MRIAVYPGTFDPITFGHLDVIQRSAGLFDRLVVAVARNPSKHPTFSVPERVAMIREVIGHLPNVTVDAFETLLVDYAKRKRASVIIRGLRAVSDFEYEFQMTLMNRKLTPEVETIFLMPSEKFTYLNSSVVKEIAMRGGDVSRFVPEAIARKLNQRFREERRRTRVR